MSSPLHKRQDPVTNVNVLTTFWRRFWHTYRTRKLVIDTTFAQRRRFIFAVVTCAVLGLSVFYSLVVSI